MGEEKEGSKWKRRLFDFLAALSVLAAAWSCQRYLVVKDDLRRVALEAINNTRGVDQGLLIFNRVPKVGSETIWKLLDALAGKNHFKSYSDSQDAKYARGGENNFMPSAKDRREYFDIFTDHASERPFTYTKHLNFLDFSEFNATAPVYINFVRDPVERVVSWYYYMRMPWKLVKVDEKTNRTVWNGKRPTNLSMGDLKMTFEDCVLSRHPACVFDIGQSMFGPFGGSHYSQMFFFCGHGPECHNFESKEMLEKAKENVERHYSVVGVLEQFDKSLEVLEEFVPFYFRDARRVYRGTVKENFHENRNSMKRRPPPEVMEALRRNFTREFEFYHFCRQRLDRQHQLLHW